MKWLHFEASQLLLLLLAAAVAIAQARPQSSASLPDALTSTAVTPAPATVVHPPPAPTVSTVLANDTAIANQFIDNLNLTDISTVTTASITNRRLNSMPNNLALIGTVQTGNSVVDLSAVVGTSIQTVSKSAVASGNRAHHGVAVPMTMEELEAEMAAATPKPVSVKHAYRTETSTAKDGITTWIPADPTTTAKAVTARPATLVAGVISQKQDKIAKIKVDTKANKVKFVPSSPKGTTTTTTTTTSTTEASTTSTATTTAKPAASKAPAIKKKAPTRPPRPSTTVAPTTPTTTTEQSKPAEPTTETEVSTTTEEKVPFDILEPKEANFDLPEDRSPGKLPATTKKPKRPTKSNGKKKPLNKNKTAAAAAAASDKDAITDLLADEVDTKNSTKTALSNLKTKQKPMSTQIYNYLSREIMPTVGVGLIGLVVTAGIAGYFLNPLGALRRSYEVADRKDDLYHYNNEEYAGVGTADGGQSEEEIFGKVIAGMPVHSSAQYRNQVRYVQPQSAAPIAAVQQQQQQQQQQHYRHPNHYRQYVGGPGAAPQQQYSRYRQSGPMAQPGSAAHPGHYAAYAGHYGQQRNVQPAPLSPNVLVQKSIAAPMYAPAPVNPISRHSNAKIQQQVAQVQPPPTAETIDAVASSDANENNEQQQQQQQSEPSADSAVENSPTPLADVEPATPETPLPSIVYSYTDKSYTDQYLDSNPNDLKRRASQFVVGSVVLADAQAAALTAADPAGKYPSIVLPEHGPRRRRRSLSMLTSNADSPASEEAIAELEVEGRSFDLNVNEADSMYADLRRRYEAAAPAVRSDKQILKEMKRLDYQVVRLRRVMAEAKDIEQFQSELHLEPKNAELHETLNNGLVQITSDIRFVGELLDEPKQAGDKLAERSMMSKRMALQKKQVDRAGEADAADAADSAAINEVKSAVHAPTTSASIVVSSSTAAAGPTTPSPYTHSIEYTTTARPSLLAGFLKMLELKSAFGVNVLRSIRPAFDRAVADVFRVNQTMYNHN